MNKLIVVLLPDHHQRLRDVRDDFASERPRPARFPRQLWRHCGWRGALWLRLEGRTKTGQPTGGDLQGGCRYSHAWADDWPTAHIRQCQSGYNPASWRWHPEKVNPRLFSKFSLENQHFLTTPQKKNAYKTHADLLLSLKFVCRTVVWETEKQVLLKNVWSHKRRVVSLSRQLG